MIAALGCILIIVALWIQKRPTQIQERAAETEQGDNPARLATPQNIPSAPAREIAGTKENEPAQGETSNQASSNTSKEEQSAASSPGVVRLKDGDMEISFDGTGNFKGLEQLAPQIQKSVQTALASETLPEPRVLNELAASKINLMGGPAEGLPFRLVAPVGVVTGSTRPTLRWQPLSGASSYTVSVFDSNFNRVAKSSPQSATTWSVPLSLQTGNVYSWEVTAMRNNQEVTSPVAPAPRAQFKIVDVEHLNEIASVRKQRPRSHLVLGVLYARAGLLAEAEREFRALLNDNPQSKAAKKLLRTVQSWRRR